MKKKMRIFSLQLYHSLISRKMGGGGKTLTIKKIAIQALT